MATKTRNKTIYPGVFFIETGSHNHKEKIYYIRYRKESRLIEEKVGGQRRNDMTPARASQVRANRINGGTLPNTERRKKLTAQKEAEKNRWTINKLWNTYSELRDKNSNYNIDLNRYTKHIAPTFGNKEPKDLIPLDIDRLRIGLLKTRSAQTTKHVLSLLRRIINFGVKKGLCPPLQFMIEMPIVNNTKDDSLTMDQISALWKAADEDGHPHAGAIIKIALLTGMRRGEIFKLKWTDVDFEKKFIAIRAPKGGRDETIPLNEHAENVLRSHINIGSDFVFPGRGGRQRTNAQKSINTIKKKAGLPDNIRPLHSLRHTFATILVNTGKVDLYTLQRLTTHKGPEMLQRYAHLGNAKLHEASGIAGQLIGALG